MLHVLLFILKIIGIILLSILGLLVLLLLIVLFVPIRYRAEIKKDEELVIKARVHWLLRAVTVRIIYIKKELSIRLKIFGICFYDNQRVKKEKPEKKSKSRKPKQKKSKQKNSSSETSLEKKELIVKNASEAKKDSLVIKEAKIDSEARAIKIIEDEDSSLLKKPSEPSQTTNLQLVESDETETVQDSESKTSDVPNSTKDSTDESILDSAEEFGEETEEELKGFFGKIKGFFRKIKNFFTKLGSVAKNIKEKFVKLLEIIKSLFVKKSLVSAFLHEEVNNSGIRSGLLSILQILRYAGPQKVIGHVKFGTGDPASTGQALGAAAILYGYYGGSFTIEPDFEEKVFEAEVKVKGRIRIARLLIIVVKLKREKNFNELLKNVKKLKEEL